MMRHKLSLTEAMFFETENLMSLELSLWYFLEPINVLDMNYLDWSSLHGRLMIVQSSVSSETIAAPTTFFTLFPDLCHDT